MTTSSSPAFAAGAEITGKWNGRTYRVERLLGEGANGRVYLVKRGKRFYALKTGFDPHDHQSEINVLRSLNRQSRHGEPFLVDVDDARWHDTEIPFYVMPYIRGARIHEFLKREGKDWFFVVGKNLLAELVRLHRKGWVFGDLKPENIMVHGYGEVELIDFGGVTGKGKAVRQFTEIYDRGYWQAGSRTADEGYDLFAFAVLCLQLMNPRETWKDASLILPQNRNVSFLTDRLASHPDRCFEVFHPFLKKALEGRFATSRQALDAWKRIEWNGREPAGPLRGLSWLNGIAAASLLLFLVALFLILQ